mmetsp:Transcript_9200/g.11592  ORF Transcript_9200/g.11592 Transcript_9200/m.11592 type:complete len:642 (-) Transcript_9200:38-1963(-)
MESSNNTECQPQSQEQRISTIFKTRLNSLTPTTSKESIQTLTKWILFHASCHPNSLQSCLKMVLLVGIIGNSSNSHTSSNISDGSKDMQNDTMTGKVDQKGSVNSDINVRNGIAMNQNEILVEDVQRWCKMAPTYWTLLHELCYIYSNITVGGGDVKKWNKFIDFRNSLAESVILPCLQEYLLFIQNISNTIDSDDDNIRRKSLVTVKEVRDKLDNMHSTWKEVDSFQSPTLLNGIKRAVSKIAQFDFDSAIANIDNGNTKSTMNAALTTTSTPKDACNTDAASGKIGQDGTEQKPDAKSDEGKTKGERNVQPTTSSTTSKGSISTPAIPDTHTDSLDNEIQSGGSNLTEVEDDVGVDEEDLFGGGHSDNDESGDDKATSSRDEENDKETEKTDTVMNIDSEGKSSTGETANEDIPASNTDIDEDISKTEKKAPINLDMEIDFEKEGISQGKVEVHEIVPSCQAIGAMQINRDLRNDYSHQLSSALSLVPKQVFDTCEDILNETSTATDTTQILNEMPEMPDEVLDYDISNALSNIKMHRQIVQKQMEQRKKSIELLIKSRCDFGSSDAAEMFYGLGDILDTLKKRKAQILDAMELEGLDFEGLDDEIGRNEEKDDDTTTFSWFSKEEAKIRQDTKKQRIE